MSHDFTKGDEQVRQYSTVRYCTYDGANVQTRETERLGREKSVYGMSSSVYFNTGLATQ
jgi:hypothetical protein